MRRLLFSTTCLVCVAAAFSARAESDAPEEIVVTATRSGDADPVSLIGSSVTVLDNEAIDQRQTRVVSDVLRDVPGTAVSRIGGIGGLTQIRMRGAEGNHTLVMIDGIKASDPYDGEFDFGTLIADENVKIEVLRGQQSALYGSDAIGGVINYITLTGAEAPGITVRAEGGSFGTGSAAARVAGVSGDLDYVLTSSFIHTNGYPEAIGGTRDVGSNNLGASFKTTWTPSSVFHLTAVGRYSVTRADVDDTDGAFGSPTFGLIVDSKGVRFRNRALYGLVKGQFDMLDGRWTNAVTLQIADTTRKGFDVVDPFSTIAGQPVVPSTGDHGQRLKGSYESAYRFGSDSIKHRITAALDVERESERTTISTFGAFLGWRHTRNIGLVGEYDLTVNDKFGFGAAVRHDANDRFADDTTYHFQATYKFDEGTRLHTATGSGIKAPGFSDLFDFAVGRYIGNPNLRPEKSKGWEAGVEQSFADNKITLNATYFDNRLQDEITTTFTASGSTSINLPGKNTQQGVELSAAARLGEDWRFDAAYTYLHAPQSRFVLLSGVPTDFTGQAVRRASNIASANLTWTPAGQPFTGTVTVRYNGRQNDVAFTDPSYTPVLVQLHSFTLVNLNATYKITDRVELFGRIENLLDKKYSEIFSFATAGRGAYGGLRVHF